MSSPKWWPISRLLGCLTLAALVCWTAGCSREEKLAPVSGKVVYAEGKPLTSGTAGSATHVNTTVWPRAAVDQKGLAVETTPLERTAASKASAGASDRQIMP